MKRICLFALAAVLAFGWLRSVPVHAEEREVLTIGDVSDHSGDRLTGEDQLGMWQYLEDQIGMEIEYIYVSQDDYKSMMNSGNLPDILVTNNNLSEIREKGLALNIEPYLEEYAPNLLKGDVGLAYQVIKEINHDEDGFWFIPQQIGPSGERYRKQEYNRGYVVRWDYYKELGYPPINNEDDYLRVLKQMHENHPYTEEGYPTYLFGIDNHTGYATAFRAGVSLDYWAAFKYQNSIFTNEIYDGYTDPEHSMWWTSMAWYNKRPEKTMDPSISKAFIRPSRSMTKNAPGASISAFTTGRVRFTRQVSKKIRIPWLDMVRFLHPTPITISTSISCWATVPPLCGLFRRIRSIGKLR